MQQPDTPKIYHIVHVDRLPSIMADNVLWSDAEVQQRLPPGTTIGMAEIKQRRMTNTLDSHPGLCVGDCVPFYFCPRSVMLYVISRRNHHKLAYREGQEPIVHLEADLHETVAWAEQHGHRWTFTLSNAASAYFQDRNDLAQLDEIDWNAVDATYWQECREEKQAEFLVEKSFPWVLVQRIGVQSARIHGRVRRAMEVSEHRPPVKVKRNWYY